MIAEGDLVATNFSFGGSTAVNLPGSRRRTGRSRSGRALRPVRRRKDQEYLGRLHEHRRSPGPEQL